MVLVVVLLVAIANHLPTILLYYVQTQPPSMCFLVEVFSAVQTHSSQQYGHFI